MERTAQFFQAIDIYEVTSLIGKKRVQNNSNQMTADSSSKETHLISCETYEYLISILII